MTRKSPAASAAATDRVPHAERSPGGAAGDLVRWAQRMRAEGRCTGCGGEPLPGRSKCETCLIAKRQYDRDRAAARGARTRVRHCPACGAQTDGGECPFGCEVTR